MEGDCGCRLSGLLILCSLHMAFEGWVHCFSKRLFCADIPVGFWIRISMERVNTAEATNLFPRISAGYAEYPDVLHSRSCDFLFR